MTTISLSRPSITDEEIKASERVLRSGWLVYGPENRAFEEELAAACGKRFCVTVSSGTAALHLGLLAQKLPLTSILSPALTFPATANVANFLPTPPQVHLADVDADTFCLRKETVQAWLDARRGPALVVHQFGYPSPLPVRNDDLLISDAACAIAVRPAMGGKLACLSFHPRKLLTTGEGGAILTDDEQLCETLRRLRAHGLTSVPGEEVMELPASGLNYRLSEPAAAIGRVQLRRLPQLVKKHRELAEQYLRNLADTGLGFQADHPDRIWQTFAVVLPEGVNRPSLRAKLKEAGIETQIASYGLHRLAAFRTAPCFSETGGPLALAVSDRLHDRGLALPLHSELSAADVHRVCQELKKALSLPEVCA
ncbi:MAG TPA: DegT/DnrJ/EryC1/StrS family aminotransferase [Pseudomonadota bacterium]|jgi:dTDP-4-amino-4,6-dideoxygalactose transaminase|nr:DegT/DnrJ/EryC1/StrS family aminotransferase [Pseudomonadota bacterium]